MNLGWLVFIEAKDDGGGGDNWTTGAISRTKLQSNHHHQQTNIQFFYRPDALPVAQPTVSKHWREKYHIPWTCLLQASNFVWPLIAPGYRGGGLPCLSSALWCQYSNSLKYYPTLTRGVYSFWFMLLQARLISAWFNQACNIQIRWASSQSFWFVWCLL